MSFSRVHFFIQVVSELSPNETQSSIFLNIKFLKSLCTVSVRT